MDVRKLLVAVSVTLVTACSGARKENAVSAPSAATATAAEPTAAASATAANASAVATATEAPAPSASAKPSMKLDVKGRDVQVQKAKGSVVYTPDSGVQKASYTHYRFKYAEYAAAVGEANLEKDAAVEAECVLGGEKSSTPADPNSPTPIGGFNMTDYDCKIVRASVK